MIPFKFLVCVFQLQNFVICTQTDWWHSMMVCVKWCGIFLPPLIVISNVIVYICLYSEHVLKKLRNFQYITSHGKNGSKPKRPVYLRNNDKISHY